VSHAPRSAARRGLVECKWNPKAFEPKGLLAFRERYPKGRNFAVCPIEGKPYQRTVSGLEVTFLSPTELVNVG
jgi:hypothetical protein